MRREGARPGWPRGRGPSLARSVVLHACGAILQSIESRIPRSARQWPIISSPGGRGPVVIPRSTKLPPAFHEEATRTPNHPASCCPLFDRVPGGIVPSQWWRPAIDKSLLRRPNATNGKLTHRTRPPQSAHVSRPTTAGNAPVPQLGVRAPSNGPPTPKCGRANPKFGKYARLTASRRARFRTPLLSAEILSMKKPSSMFRPSLPPQGQPEVDATQLAGLCRMRTADR